MRARCSTTVFIGGVSAALLAACLVACVDVPRRPLDPAASEQKLRAKSLDDPALRDLCVEKLGLPAEPWPPKEIDLAVLVLAALKFRPELDVARAQVAAAEAKAKNSGRLPNPSLSVAGGPVDNDGSVPPWILTVALDFVIPTAGKLGKSVAIADQELELARLEGAATVWRVYAEVRDAWFALGAAGTVHALDAIEVAARRKIVELTKARVEAGLAARPELLSTQSALDLAASAEHASERTWQLAGRRLFASCGIVAADDRSVPKLAGTAEPSMEALAEIETSKGVIDRIDVRRALAEYEAAERELELELAKQYPDVRLGPGWEYDQGDRKYTLGVGIDLPLFDRNQAGIAAAVARRGEVAARFEQLQSSAFSEIELARREWTEASRRLAERFGEMARRVEARRAAAEAALNAGAIDQLAFLDVEIERNDFSRTSADVTRSYRAAQSRLEDALQRPLDARLAELAARSALPVSAEESPR